MLFSFNWTPDGSHIQPFNDYYMSILYTIFYARYCRKMISTPSFLSLAVADLIAIALVYLCLCVRVSVCLLATDLLDKC